MMAVFVWAAFVATTIAETCVWAAEVEATTAEICVCTTEVGSPPAPLPRAGPKGKLHAVRETSKPDTIIMMDFFQDMTILL
jgi:hypothetical protein